MTTENRTVTLAGLDPAPSNDDTPDSYLQRLAEELEGVAADQVRIKVYRIPERGPRELCRDYTAGEILTHGIESIRREWGAGLYELIRYGSSGIASRSRIALANTLAPAVVEQRREFSELGEVLRALLESQARILQSIEQSRQTPQPTRAEMLRELAEIRTLFAPTSAPDASAPLVMFREMMGVFREAKSAAKELAGEAPEREPNLMEQVAPLIDVVKTAITQPQALSAAQPVQLIQAPASVQNASAATVPATVENPISSASTIDEAEEGRAILLGLVLQLVQLARRGDESIEEGAEFIADNLPDELLQFMNHPQWFEFVSAQFPKLAPHEDWLRKSKARADELLKEESSD